MSRFARRRRDDDGFALVMVICVVAIMSLLVIASLQYAVGSQRASRRDQDFHAALAAAEAGVDDYLFRLNRDGDYWLFGDPADGGGVLGDTTNGAFTGWAPVPGPVSEATFRYDVDVSRFRSEGIIELAATGRVKEKTRTVDVKLRRRNFLDYLYFTDFETRDPALYNGTPFTPAQAQATCARYYYGATTRDGNCTSINFTSRDAINGPLHSNDAILVCGAPRFNGDTSTSWADPANVRYRVNTACGTASPVFSRSGDPRLTDVLTLPPSNSSIRAEVDATTSDNPGCLYVGPTRVVLTSNGRMNVSSPWTKVHNAGCGTGDRPLPPNGVIYVDNVPVDNSSDPNSWSTGAGAPAMPVCRANGNAIGYPITNDITRYGCRTGDVFVEGTLRGQLTVAAANNIVATWHLRYNSGTTGSDLLGLVANNFIEVYHPVNSSGTNLDHSGSRGRFLNPEIRAAILSVAHSFRVQNYEYGACLGPLQVDGAIAQKYRGIVGTFSGTSCYSGYDKAYSYDNRLKYQSPPHFLDPVRSAYGINTWAETQSTY